MNTQSTAINQEATVAAQTEKMAPSADLQNKMAAYAKRYLKRHPKIDAAKLSKIVCKKFNVKLT